MGKASTESALPICEASLGRERVSWLLRQFFQFFDGGTGVRRQHLKPSDPKLLKISRGMPLGSLPLGVRIMFGGLPSEKTGS